MALTVKKVRDAGPGMHLDGRGGGGVPGLYLQCRTTNDGKSKSKSWLLRYEMHGRERWMGLGSESKVSLEQARDRAREAHKQLYDGIDPIDDRRTTRERQRTEALDKIARTRTFEEAAERYYEFHSKKWHNAKHSAQFLSSLKAYAYPTIGKTAVGSVNREMVLRILEPIWSTKNETASRVRSRIENVLDYAKTQGWRSGENPAAWSGNLKHALAAPGQIKDVENQPALPWDELPAFMVELRKRHGVAARGLELTILCASRTGEIIGARWDEFDFDKRVWTVPAERMGKQKKKKGKKKPHEVPLSDRAVAILEDLPREGDFVFPGGVAGQAISNMAMAAVIKRMNKENDKAGLSKWIDPKLNRAIVPHGFRSTFRDWAAETTNYPNHVVEKALAHVIGDKVEAAYRRGGLIAKRKQLMDTWAKYCASPPRSKESSKSENVVPMRRGGK
jgi:integrase